MPGLPAPEGHLAAARPPRYHRFQGQARGLVPATRGVAAHAVIGPLHPRDTSRAEAVKEVENPAELWVDRDHLHLAVGDEPDVRVVVEVDRARLPRRDQPLLKA